MVLAVVVERNGKAIMYDSGNRWNTGSAAQRIILPYLRWRGLHWNISLSAIAIWIILAGCRSCCRRSPQASVHSPLSEAGHLPCIQGQQWHWQGLRIKALWPPRRVNYATNDDSCVIRLDDGPTQRFTHRRSGSQRGSGAAASAGQFARHLTAGAASRQQNVVKRRLFYGRWHRKRRWLRLPAIMFGAYPQKKSSVVTGKIISVGMIRRVPDSSAYFFSTMIGKLMAFESN
ncbi:ComEC family competence protein [Serratia odorifera]|uniref:ComEC family competence protein n=1 Tax=Serratia odorifera TaxID=618 RepID=A0A447L1B6_SEROD|nr:ComEC family competence protein [Serratia odorifera]